MPSETRRRILPAYLHHPMHLAPILRGTLSAPAIPQQLQPLSPWTVLNDYYDDRTDVGFPESPTQFIRYNRDRTTADVTSPQHAAGGFLCTNQSVLEYDHVSKTLQPWYW
jgi:hypothetical protein